MCAGASGAIQGCFNEAAGIPRGRREQTMRDYPEMVVASMRPRVFPAEDPHLRIVAPDRRRASMRPRVFPAEDPPLNNLPAPIAVLQ